MTERIEGLEALALFIKKLEAADLAVIWIALQPSDDAMAFRQNIILARIVAVAVLIVAGLAINFLRPAEAARICL